MFESFANKKVLITGGLGFIGSSLAQRLVGLGAQVTLVDSMVPEYGGNLYNVNEILVHVRINISDVRDEHSFKHIIKDQDYLFNLAGQTSHMDSMVDPFTDLEINSRAQLSILEACRKFNPSVQVVFASTRQLYGRPDYLPVDEKHLLRPVDVNGVNKMAGEWFHILYNNVHGVRACVLRLTNTIGPRMRIKDARQTFVGIWIRRILEGLPFEVWGGDQLRDFTYVDDAVEALLQVALSEKANGAIFNLGGKEILRLRDLAEALIEASGCGSYVVREYPAERKAIDIGDYYSDWSHINRTTGWHPSTDIGAALTKTMTFYKEHFGKYI